MALVTQPRSTLLLDEVAAGLTQSEAEAMAGPIPSHSP